MFMSMAYAALEGFSLLSKPAKILVAVCFGVTLALMVFSLAEAQRDVDRQRNAYTIARDNWLGDCTHMGPRIDQCTKAWSDDPTLREIYIERIADEQEGDKP